MKRQLIHTALLAAGLLAAACSGEPVAEIGSAGGCGALRVKIASAAGSAADGPVAVRIYDAGGGLIRRYADAGQMPEALELLAGDYRAAVEAGEREEASFTHRYYRGEADFHVVAGQLATVKIPCKLQNTVVDVKFDAAVAGNFPGGYHAEVVAASDYDAEKAASGAVPSLRYTSDATGYFMLPEGVTSICWRFEGEHADAGATVAQGRLDDLGPGDRCVLRFRYSADLPGYVECFTLRVDPSTEDFDDEIVWTDLDISGPGLDGAAVDCYPGGGLPAWRVDYSTPVRAIAATFAGETFDVLSDPRFRVTEGEGFLTVSLAEAFLSGLPGGQGSLVLRVEDENNGELERSAMLRMQGVLPVSAADYDLWDRTATLRALVLDPDATDPAFFFGGSEIRAEAAGDGIYVARVSPVWSEEQTNEAGLAFRTLAAGSGVCPSTSYEWRMECGGVSSATRFSTGSGPAIPNGDMEDGSCSCFTKNNGTTAFWGSGNNDYMSSIIGTKLMTLCTQQERGGSKCAALATQQAAGILAAGNLFTGTFVKPSTEGTVAFGKDYDWSARPRALRLKYHATVGAVNRTKHKTEAGTDPLASGEQDRAIVYAAIVDWERPHEVISGTSRCAGMWDPSAAVSQAEGAVLGYARLLIGESSPAEEEMVPAELDIHWYDTQLRPSKPCKIVISCSANMYGDYMCGCDTNRLYVDDFEWVY